MMYLEMSSKLRRVRLDEKELLRGEGFARNSEDLSGCAKIMLDARELPEGVGETPAEMNPAEEAIKPSGT
jgi:hypothetical protein